MILHGLIFGLFRFGGTLLGRYGGVGAAEEDDDGAAAGVGIHGLGLRRAVSSARRSFKMNYSPRGCPRRQRGVFLQKSLPQKLPACLGELIQFFEPAQRVARYTRGSVVGTPAVVILLPSFERFAADSQDEVFTVPAIEYRVGLPSLSVLVFGWGRGSEWGQRRVARGWTRVVQVVSHRVRWAGWWSKDHLESD